MGFPEITPQFPGTVTLIGSEPDDEINVESGLGDIEERMSFKAQLSLLSDDDVDKLICLVEHAGNVLFESGRPEFGSLADLVWRTNTLDPDRNAKLADWVIDLCQQVRDLQPGEIGYLEPKDAITSRPDLHVRKNKGGIVNIGVTVDEEGEFVVVDKKLLSEYKKSLKDR